METATFEEIRQILKEVSLQSKETDRKFQDTDRKFQETREQLREESLSTDRKFQESRLQLMETERIMREQMKELRQEIGGIGKSQGEVAENYFYNAIKRNMQLLHIDLREIERNINKYNKDSGIKEEYDLVLTNSNVIVLVEIKYKMRKNYIQKFHDIKIPNFRKLYPEKKDFTILGAIAAFSFDKDCIEQAKEYGFLILTRVDKHFEVINENLINY